MIAIYQQKHFKVLAIENSFARLLSDTDEILTVCCDKISIFKKLSRVKKKTKKRRISAKVLQRQADLTPELKSFDNAVAKRIEEFKSQRA